MPSILLVCTGNVCRSPMAEGLLRVALERRLGDAAPAVGSAGVIGRDGGAAVPEAVEAAADRGVDISSHVVRRLGREHVEPAALVLGMAVEHREDVVRTSPSAASRTFTLKEFVRLLEAQPASRTGEEGDPGGRLAARVAEADRLRCSGFRGNPSDEDVIDPLGLSLETYRAIAWELDGWCERLVDGLFGAVGIAEPAISRHEGLVEGNARPSALVSAIRTTCPRCGDVTVGSDAMVLSVADDRSEGSYRYRCPSCTETVEKPADRKIMAILVSAGVATAHRTDARAGAGAEEG